MERTFGWLEQHWSGSLLDSVETVINFAKALTFQGKHPVVKFVNTVYETGVRLKKKEMERLETQFYRQPGLEKWFVTIPAISRE